jgi:predicted transcriptional regulator
MQEKAFREIVKGNMKRIVEELRGINLRNTSDLIRKEEVEGVQKEIEQYIDGLDESIKINVSNDRERVEIGRQEKEFDT